MSQTQLPNELEGAGETRLRRIVYVGGLDETKVDKDVLRKVFETFGEIRNVEISMDKTSGKNRGFGFVEFEEEIDAQEAILNMDQSELFGRTIYVNPAKNEARSTSASLPVWADDLLFRKRLAEEGLM